MPDTDTILAVLQSEIGLAGLMLVFVGFLLNKTAAIPPKYAHKFKYLTIMTLFSFLANLVLSFLCVRALRGSATDGNLLLSGLEVSLGISALVGIVGLIAAL